MKAEAELQWLADFYSEIMPTRRHALNHLFCTIGNGYEWVDGELVETTDSLGLRDRYKLTEDVPRAIFRFESLKAAAIKSERNTRRQIAQLFEQKHNTADPKELQRLTTALLQNSRGLAFTWYPLCPLSHLYSVPDNVKPDWAALVEETKQLLADDGIDWTLYGKPNPDHGWDETLINNVRETKELAARESAQQPGRPLYTLHTEPMSKADLRLWNETNSGYVGGDILLSLQEIIGRDLDSFLDLISTKLTGSELLSDTRYWIVGLTADQYGDTAIRLRVSGDMSMMQDELYDDDDMDLTALDGSHTLDETRGAT